MAPEAPAPNTPLTADELADIIPDLSTKEELNEWERENILRARTWALSRIQLARRDPLTEPYVRELHRRMFGQTWKWAGTYRKTEKNLGVPVHQVLERLGTLLADARYWVEHSTYAADEVAVRVHHQLVVIHPFPNGNGRHARLIADILVSKWKGHSFTWGRRDLLPAGAARDAYLRALRLADNGDIRPLLEFSRS